MPAALSHSPCVCQDRKHSLLGFLQIGWMVSVTQHPTREQKGKASVDRKHTPFQPHRARAQSSFRDTKGCEGSVGVPTARVQVTEAEPGDMGSQQQGGVRSLGCYYRPTP